MNILMIMNKINIKNSGIKIEKIGIPFESITNN